jgi:phosphoglycerate kinase
VIKKTIRDIDLANKTVLVRVDFNVPVKDGEVGDELRIAAALPTLRYLHEQNCRQVLISHLGRPEGKSDPRYSLRPVAQKLSELMQHEIGFVPDCVGSEVEQAVKALPEHGMILLENLRFRLDEEKGDDELGEQLAKLGQVFVYDAFAVAHHAGALTSSIAERIPAVAGLLLEREVDTISAALESPRRPLLAVIGGAKVGGKIDVLSNLIAKSDTLFIAGAMANTFLAAQGRQVGKSIQEPEEYETAKKVMAAAEEAGIRLFLPGDVAVADKINPAASARKIAINEVGESDYILDVGPQTIEAVFGDKQYGTVIWNGPLGYTEIPQFAEGSRLLAEKIIASGAHSIVGGGDTAAFVDEAGLHDKFSFVSTGGGASLELMAGKALPGVAALLGK